MCRSDKGVGYVNYHVEFGGRGYAVLCFCLGCSRSGAGSPIHDAAKAGDAVQVKRLIGAGTDVNEKDIAQKTALHWAADAGHMDVVQVLVGKGANVNAKDFTDVTPLQLAVFG